MNWTKIILNAALYFFIGIIVIYATRYYLFSLFGHRKAEYKVKPFSFPFISIVVPAHNEEKVIARTITRLIDLEYPPEKMEIIIINDSSVDNTARILDFFSKNGLIKILERCRYKKKEKFMYEQNNKIHKLERNMDKSMQGKAAALNSVLDFADKSSEIIVLFDGDHYPENKDILSKIVSYMTDEKVCIVQADVRTINANTNIITKFVSVERDSANIDQNARSFLGAIPQHSGTAAGIRVSFLREAGGWDEDSLTDDTDLTFAAVSNNYKIIYDPDLVSWEEGVDNLKAYWKQRTRWARGHMRVFFKYWYKVLTSSNLTFRERIDGFFLLAYYFIPIIIGLSFILILTNKFFVSFLMPTKWSAFILFYTSFALFFETIQGLRYRKSNFRRYLNLALIPFFSVFNIFICFYALSMEVSGKERNKWIKTERSGLVSEAEIAEYIIFNMEEEEIAQSL
ncbi:MAG: glycosyltransferase family 2 protein [Actinobacteria bacterium]|nr:glycosyltransferase family 2 protein [Actinomycetota bacterium]